MSERLSSNQDLSINKFPWRGPQPLGMHFLGKIFLRESLWRDYISGVPQPQTTSIIAHEQVHADRLGSSIQNNLKYWTNRTFRLQEEIAAIKEEMSILKNSGEQFKIDERCRNLSSIWYLWCTDYETARKELENIWREL